MVHPCRIPREMLNLWDVPNESEIELLMSLYNIFIKEINLLPKPNFSRELKMKLCSIMSNAFLTLKKLI